MPKVTLIEFTGKGRVDEHRHAANLLVFTKSTRLQMEPGLLPRIQAMSDEDIKAELNYMVGTIASSWEFIDLTFLISGVTRACAQQMTRTRTASYAMQSQRVADLQGVDYHNPCDTSPAKQIFAEFADKAISNYQVLRDVGAPAEQARGLLPMNVHCNLVAKYNLRSLVQLVLARESVRTQGEYATVVDQYKQLTIDAWPWAAPFFQSKSKKALAMLGKLIDEVGMETGTGIGWELAKIQDLIR